MKMGDLLIIGTDWDKVMMPMSMKKVLISLQEDVKDIMENASPEERLKMFKKSVEMMEILIPSLKEKERKFIGTKGKKKSKLLPKNKIYEEK